MEIPTICQVLHTLNVGGAEVLAYRLAKQLGGRYRFVFACLDEVGTLGSELRDAGFRVEVLDRQPGLDFRCRRRLADFVRRESVDLLHAHQYTPFFYSLAAGIARRRPPILFTEHGRFYPDRRSSKRVVFNRLLLRGRDRVVAVGHAVRRALVDNEGIFARRIGVIYNGVELPEGVASPRERAALRCELGVAAADLVLMLVARLDPIKDHILAIRAMKSVVLRFPRTCLFLVGDGPERGKMEKEIAQHGMTGHVRLLGQRRDVQRLLAAADIFLLTSLSEGIPVTLIEAMGARVPIVATDVGGVPEVVQDGETGILVHSRSADEVAAAIIRLAGEPETRTRMGEAGRRRAERLFREERMHACYARLYEEMLDDGP